MIDKKLINSLLVLMGQMQVVLRKVVTASQVQINLVAMKNLLFQANRERQNFNQSMAVLLVSRL